MGLSDLDVPSIAVSREEALALSAKWAASLPASGAAPTKDEVSAAARAIYAEYPEVLSSLGL